MYTPSGRAGRYAWPDVHRPRPRRRLDIAIYNWNNPTILRRRDTPPKPAACGCASSTKTTTPT
ncbi:MAG: hypothetical protein WKG07_29055 [Hymenobacter sp.]